MLSIEASWSKVVTRNRSQARAIMAEAVLRVPEVVRNSATKSAPHLGQRSLQAMCVGSLLPFCQSLHLESHCGWSRPLLNPFDPLVILDPTAT